MVTAEQNVRRLKRLSLVAAALQLLSVAAVLALVAFIVVPSLRAGGAFASTAFAALYLWYFIRTFRMHTATRPRVVPYFELKYFRSGDPSRKTAEESWSAFLSGTGIAADLQRLDDLAGKLGVAPLSSFGFGDDLLKQHPQWSDITEGLRTLSALVAKVREPSPVSFDGATVTDLQTLATALEKARETQSTFCLILRHGADNAISGVEMEKRQGSFWF
jgi:hypothetical protein